MDPFTLIALATTAGFIFSKRSSQAKENIPKPQKRHKSEFVYEPEIVASAKNNKEAEFDLDRIEVLKEYEVVKMLIENKFPLIFVTGGAGTGKSTFIKWITKSYKGAVLLGAPTGMAAINIEGKTLHSLFQLPPAWITKSDIKKAPRRREIATAELLIIDEISMVTANLLDAVSAFLKLNRSDARPFGGLPVVIIGDLFQLPPVVSDSTRANFERVYGTANFFNARCLTQCTYYAVELRKTFRQSEQYFVDLLSKIREGINLDTTINELNQNCKITPQPPSGAVWLSPRNSEVDTINFRHLNALEGHEFTYKGIIHGNFKDDRLPSPLNLKLKVGAQVMFTKNDKGRRWVNGTVGFVKKLGPEKIVVDVNNLLLDVSRENWDDFKYKWNPISNEIERETIGTYEQFPLALAWAMTIHKSQGKTIDKVHIELGAGAFETGQTYVALSRCREISGLTLSRPLAVSDVLVDSEAKQFYEQLRGIIEKLPPEKMIEQIKSENRID